MKKILFPAVCIMAALMLTTFAIPAAPQPPLIPVLTYHSIKSHEFYHPINTGNPWILSESAFYEQMSYLYHAGFTPLTSYQLIDFLFYGGDLPPRPIILTFDDGYLDNYLFAAPILRQFGFMGMVFLITSAIADPAPPMAAWPTPFMGFAEIESSADVFEFGSHTHNMHQVINGVAPYRAAARDEILRDILVSLEYPLTLTTGFAYPHGAHTPAAVSALTEAGIRFAFTTRTGYLHRASDPMLIPRFAITSDMSMEKFIDIVNGNY